MLWWPNVLFSVIKLYPGGFYNIPQDVWGFSQFSQSQKAKLHQGTGIIQMYQPVKRMSLPGARLTLNQKLR